METKLTLRLEEKLIHEAKNIAKSKGISLSKMVADYFKALMVGSKKEWTESPILSEITGVLPRSLENKDIQRDYKRHLEEKYL